MSQEESAIQPGNPSEAVAHFAASIALTLFALLLAAVAIVGASLLKWDLLVLIGGIGALILLIMAISAYLEGSRAMPRRDGDKNWRRRR